MCIQLVCSGRDEVIMVSAYIFFCILLLIKKQNQTDPLDPKDQMEDLRSFCRTQWSRWQVASLSCAPGHVLSGGTPSDVGVWEPSPQGKEWGVL